MRIATIAVLTLAASLSSPAVAAVSDLVGTWECRLPGNAPTRTPPILWIQEARGNDPSRVVVEVDGFARDLDGFGQVTEAAGGWMKIVPDRGAPLLARATASPRGVAAPAMEVRRTETGPAYRCLRLPRG